MQKKALQTEGSFELIANFFNNYWFEFRYRIDIATHY